MIEKTTTIYASKILPHAIETYTSKKKIRKREQKVITPRRYKPMTRSSSVVPQKRVERGINVNEEISLNQKRKREI